MKLPVINFDNKACGEVEASEEIFATPFRADLVQRTVLWHASQRRSGTRQVKGRSEIRGSNRKIARQKGTGRARHGSKKVSQFRGGGRAFGLDPDIRRLKLNRKIRRLALCSVLAEKQRQNSLIVIEDDRLRTPKTAAIHKKLQKLDCLDALIVVAEPVGDNLRLSTRNLPCVRLLPSQAANVYDILRHEKLILSKSALSTLEQRLR